MICRAGLKPRPVFFTGMGKSQLNFLDPFAGVYAAMLLQIPIDLSLEKDGTRLDSIECTG